MLIGNFEDGALKLTGSGFVAGDGQDIVTNKHVVTGTDEKPDALRLVFFSGTEKARIVEVPASRITLYGSLSRKDKKYFQEDLAKIRIGAMVAKPLPTTQPVLRETMAVWAFGFPRGIDLLSDQDMPSASVHTMRIERIESEKNITTILQLSGSPTQGNSGGPVVTAQGEVVGVVQAKDAEAPIIFAIPSVRVSKLIAGNLKGSKSIAQRFSEPLKSVANPDKSGASKPAVESTRSSDRGPIQSYDSVLNIEDLSTSALVGMSSFELTILRNEPFARRGYIFKRRELRNAFDGVSWYRPRTSNLAAVQRLLTRREIRNIELIKRYQNENGLNF